MDDEKDLLAEYKKASVKYLWEEYKDASIEWRNKGDRLMDAAKELIEDANTAYHMADEYTNLMKDLLVSEEDTSDFE